MSFDINEEKFLGYPKCCIDMNMNVFTGYKVAYIELYSIIKDVRARKRSIKWLKSLIDNLIFLIHIPCKITCTESLKLGGRYNQIIKKYMRIAHLPTSKKK